MVSNRRSGAIQQKKNNVLISGIPRKKEENLLELVVALAAKLGVSIKEHDIDIAHRMPSKKDQTTIIVKLNNRMKKQELTRASKKMKLKSDCIGLSPALPIFCDDHLTMRNKYLLKLAKDLKKEGIIQFVWVRDCTIFIKAEETGPTMIIKEEAQIDRIRNAARKNSEESEQPGSQQPTVVAPKPPSKAEKKRNLDARSPGEEPTGRSYTGRTKFRKFGGGDLQN